MESVELDEAVLEAARLDGDRITWWEVVSPFPGETRWGYAIGWEDDPDEYGPRHLHVYRHTREEAAMAAVEALKPADSMSEGEEDLELARLLKELRQAKADGIIYAYTVDSATDYRSEGVSIWGKAGEVNKPFYLPTAIESFRAAAEYVRELSKKKSIAYLDVTDMTLEQMSRELMDRGWVRYFSESDGEPRWGWDADFVSGDILTSWETVTRKALRKARKRDGVE